MAPYWDSSWISHCSMSQRFYRGSAGPALFTYFNSSYMKWMLGWANSTVLRGLGWSVYQLFFFLTIQESAGHHPVLPWLCQSIQQAERSGAIFFWSHLLGSHSSILTSWKPALLFSPGRRAGPGLPIAVGGIWKLWGLLFCSHTFRTDLLALRPSGSALLCCMGEEQGVLAQALKLVRDNAISPTLITSSSSWGREGRGEEAFSP